jgi:transposase
MKKFIRTAVDLGKNYFQFHGLAGEGGAPVSRKLKRSKVLEFYAQIEPCRVGMEAAARHIIGPANLSRWGMRWC